MAITALAGTASHVSQGSDYSYAASNNGPVAIKNQLVGFRLDNKPVMFRTRTLPSITEGDKIVVGGSEKNGTFEALALRNLTTGAIYQPPTIFPMILAGVLILIGIPLIALLGIGLIFVGFGGVVLFKAFKYRSAGALIKNHPADLAVPSPAASGATSYTAPS